MQSGRESTFSPVSRASTQSVVAYIVQTEMASNDVITLPALQPKVRYAGVPRRYEETKPVYVRDLTHKKIISKYVLGLHLTS